MTYRAQWQLTYNDEFVSRSRAALIEQANVFKDDARPQMVSLADDIIRGVVEPITAFQQLLAISPGFVDTADNGDGTIDSSKIVDGDILSSVQANWPVVAQLYYHVDGSRLT